VVAVGDVADPRMVTRLPHRVPADLRDARHAGELHDRAAEETEARLASVLLAAVEQQLHPHADPEERHAALARAAQPGYEAVAVELARAVAEVPDPRKHHRRRLPQAGRVPDEPGARADGRERLLGAREIADAVIDDGDHGLRTEAALARR